MNGPDWREHTQHQDNPGTYASTSQPWPGNTQNQDNPWHFASQAPQSWPGNPYNPGQSAQAPQAWPGNAGQHAPQASQYWPQSSWYPHPQQYFVQPPSVGAQRSHSLLLTQNPQAEASVEEPPFVAVNPWGPSRRFGRSTRPSIAQPPLRPHTSAHGPIPQAPQILLPPIPIPSFPWARQVTGGETGRLSHHTAQRPPYAPGSATNAMVLFNPSNADEGRSSQQLITAGGTAEQQDSVPHLPLIGLPRPADPGDDSGSAKSSQQSITDGRDAAAAEEQNPQIRPPHLTEPGGDSGSVRSSRSSSSLKGERISGPEGLGPNSSSLSTPRPHGESTHSGTPPHSTHSPTIPPRVPAADVPSETAPVAEAPAVVPPAPNEPQLFPATGAPPQPFVPFVPDDPVQPQLQMPHIPPHTPPSFPASFTPPPGFVPQTFVPVDGGLPTPVTNPTRRSRRNFVLSLQDAVIVAFLRLAQKLYLNFLLRIPSLYFSRVTRIFEDAQVTLPEIRRMALDEWNSKEKTKKAHMFFAQHDPTVLPRSLLTFRSSWEGFIDSLMREWKTFNIISVLLLSSTRPRIR
ncbi:hypothetical protein FB451DRAFT_623051 [Mycena latifolia]|nr:hypothetical protein FB451DRAFT_623051 [Mycena latifolia]